MTVGSIIATTLTATGHTLTLTGTGSNIRTMDLGSLIVNANAGGNVGALTAGTVNVTGGTLSLGGDSDLGGATITLAESGVIKTNTGVLTVGSVSGAGTIQGYGGVVLGSSINSPNLDIIAENGDINATAGGVTNANSMTATNGNIVANGKNITAGTISAKGNVTANNITAGTISVSGIVTAATVAATHIYFNDVTPIKNDPLLRATKILNGSGFTTLHLENMSLTSALELDKSYPLIQLDNASIGAENGLTKLSYKDGNEIKEVSLPNSAEITIISNSISEELTNTTINAKDSHTIKTDTDKKTISYTHYSPMIENINVRQVTETSDLIPKGWKAAAGGVTIETENMTLPTDMVPGDSRTIICGNTTNGNADFFKTLSSNGKLAITGANLYTESSSEESNYVNGSKLSWTNKRGVTYDAVSEDIRYIAPYYQVTKVNLGEYEYKKGTTARTFDSEKVTIGEKSAYRYKFDSFEVDANNLSFKYNGEDNKVAPDRFGNSTNMTLFATNYPNGSTNAIMNASSKTLTSEFTGENGVTVSASATGSITTNSSAEGTHLHFSLNALTISSLSIGDVDWTKDADAMPA